MSALAAPTPELVVVTDRAAAAAAGRDVVDAVRAALDGGAPAILLRDKERSLAERRALGEVITPLVRASGATLWITDDPSLALELDADGLHLPGNVQRPTDWDGPISRSVHDATELERARRDGAAHAYVAPVAPTASKPGYGPALGTPGLRRLVASGAPLPLIALGGVAAGNVAAWRRAGAAGVAVMGGVMGADDPAQAVRDLLAAWHGTDRRGAMGPPAVRPTTNPRTTEPR